MNKYFGSAVLETISDPDRFEFVQSPPDYLHIKCPVCFEILLPEPHLVSCCGNHFCKKCISALGKNEPCPLCKAAQNTYHRVPDRGLERALNSLKVYCPNKPKSCEWAGEFSSLQNHLSSSCLYVHVPCKYKCGSSVVRVNLTIHESQRCPHRPEKCRHCKTYSAIYVQVLHHERMECPKAEIDCPNKCGAQILRETQSAHMQCCPLVKVGCTFAHAGCKWLDTKSKLDDHLEDSWRQHISLISSFTTKLVQKQDKKISELSEKVQNQEVIIKHLGMEIDDLKRSQLCYKSKLNLPSVPSGKRTLKFTIDRFKYKQTHNNLHYSPPFKFGDLPGYSMQLTVYLNGVNKGKGSHISVYVNLLSSQHDDWLTWPFHGSILIRICNQGNDFDHYEEVITFDDSATLESCILPSGSFGNRYGMEKFIEHTALKPYLKNDSLLFELPQVII